MKQILITLTILLSTAYHLSGQYLMGPNILYDNHYLVDKYIINPAFTGSKYYPHFFIGTHRMDLQIRNAPSVHIVGIHSRLGIRKNYSARYRNARNEWSARNAIGGMVFADKNGPFQTVGLKLDYAYHIPFDTHSTLSFGLGGMLTSKGLKLSKYQMGSNADDPLIAENSGKLVVIPDFNAGVVFTHHQLYVGFSVAQLLENSYRFSAYRYEPTTVYRNFYLLAGYRFRFSGLEFEPSFVVGRNLASDHSGNNGNFIDTNMEFLLKPLKLTLSYRLDGFVSIALEYQARRLSIGIRSDLFSTNSQDANFSGIGVMVAFSFLPSKLR